MPAGITSPIDGRRHFVGATLVVALLSAISVNPIYPPNPSRRFPRSSIP